MMAPIMELHEYQVLNLINQPKHIFVFLKIMRKLFKIMRKAIEIIEKKLMGNKRIK
jgi:hypothetical protein